MTRHPFRTHTCAQIRLEDVGQRVRLAGWIHRKRNHGQLLFIDLRDYYGITQCVVDTGHKMFPVGESMSSESVVSITGEVLKRSDDTVNAGLSTGRVEVGIEDIKVLSKADELPLPVFGEPPYPEELRFKYRYLDLRRSGTRRCIVLRSQVISAIRKLMEERGFLEIQTPILTSSSPEGARDFLVPSRLHPGRFYALPQAPQIFKQLIIASGFDKYFQIAPCFRDEDARADRSPGEFYQLDMEMAFVTREDIFQVMGEVMASLFSQFTDTCIDGEFPRLSYQEAMGSYGTDKPDLRLELKIVEVTEVFARSDFGLFARAIERGCVVKAIAVEQVASRPRGFFDKLNEWAKEEGAKGMGYIVYNPEQQGPIAKHLTHTRHERLKALTKVSEGGGVFFVCAPEAEALHFAGVARKKLGNVLNLVKKGMAFCWITDYPMYQRDPVSGRWDFAHNPFSMPLGELEVLVTQNPANIVSQQYDMVCNGVELSSGAIRNHRLDIMKKAFSIAGYTEEDIKEKFSGLYEAFHYGVPPHGGLAPGIERIVMLLADVQTIREVMPFPMNQQGEDLMMGSPCEVETQQMKDLHLLVKPLKKK